MNRCSQVGTALWLAITIAPTAAAIGEHQLAISDQTPSLIAYTNVNLVAAPGEFNSNAVVVIKDGKIHSVNNNIPAGAKVIDLEGKYLYPGFIDSYSQYGLDWQYSFDESDKPQYQIDRFGSRHPNSAVHSEMVWSDHFSPDKDAAKKWQKNGFTSVHSAWQDGIFQGQGFVASLAQQSDYGLIYQPQSGAWLSFDKGSSPLAYPQSVMGSMALIRQVLAEGQWYKSQQGKPQLAPQQSLQALTQFNKQPAFFKGKHPDDILRAAKLLNNNNAVYLGTGLEFERIPQLKQLSMQLIVPLNFARKPQIDSIYDPAQISLTTLRHWERSPSNLAELAKHKLPFAITLEGLDADKFLPNLRQAMQHGLTAEQALAALTTTPAQFLGLEQQLGKIAPGYRADLVISDGDLFVDGRIEAVVTQGQWQQIAPKHRYAIRGQWQLEWQNQALEMALFVEEGKLKGQFEQGETVLTLNKLNASQAELSFQLDTAELGGEGTATVTLNGNRDYLSGYALLSSGERIEVSAKRGGENDAKADDVEPLAPLVSRQTYPNVAFGQPQPVKAQSLHIKNATIWTSTEQGNLLNSDVLVRQGKISKIGQNLKTPSGYQVIDASGKHLTAGIIDEHSHIAIHGGVNEASDNISAEVHIGDVLDPSDIHIYRALAGGVTSAQLLHGSANPIGGQAQVIKLRWGADADGLKFTQAPPSIKFALGENVKQSNWGDDFKQRYPQTRMGVEALLRDGFQRARNQQQAQQDYDDLSRSAKKRTVAPKPDLRLNTVLEVLNNERHIHVHSYVQSEILMMLDLAAEMDFKVQTFTHILEGYKVASEMAAAGTSASTFADWWAYKFEVYDAIPQNACLLNEQGVLTSINSDSRDLIRRLNQEAAKSMMYCGMDEQQAWQMVTLNPAKQLKVDHLVGSIETGKQADLVLWSANPLSVYARAEQTWIEGASYFSLAQDKQQRDAVANERAALLAKVMADSSPASAGIWLTPEPVPAWHCDSAGQTAHANHSH
ncbi:amidohydrolase family protein [uncultured Ferrimonas sp.]|uniref:amidohydrolase family protein n=1 Tax=uncultured Ferrimonas sp. TaxID=432640 RepID=UPI002621D4ED|nr:amidohydrolase family protein [uncultured Ferrimonas sp.]